MNSALLLDGKIELSFAYDERMIALVKTLPDRTWDSSNKVWKLPATKFHAQSVINKLPEFYVDPAITKLANQTEKVELSLPKEFKHLYHYQKEGVKFIANAHGNCIVADDMGLGKSAEALVYLSMLRVKSLIVSPSNVIYKWKDEECRRWAPSLSALIIKSGTDELLESDITIMSYAMMVAKYEEIKAAGFELVIFDEAHYLKSPKSQRGRVAKSLAKHIQRKLYLSGTPFENRPAELFPILNAIDPVGFNNFYSYATRYCGAIKEGNFFQVPRNVATNASELAGRLKNYMIRRTKQEVALQLPELSRSMVPVPLSKTTEYKKALAEFQDWAKSSKKKTSALVKLTALRQIIGKEKLEPAIELAESVLESGRQVVLFAHHKEVVSALHKHFKLEGCGVISGDTAPEDRQKLARAFNLDNSKIRVMIITVAGAEGINLYGASDIIFVEREWTPAKEEQAEARLHRLGQKNAVTSYYLVATGTIDEHMNKLVEEKRKLFNQVIGQDEILTSILEKYGG